MSFHQCSIEEEARAEHSQLVPEKDISHLSANDTKTEAIEWCLHKIVMMV